MQIHAVAAWRYFFRRIIRSEKAWYDSIGRKWVMAASFFPNHTVKRSPCRHRLRAEFRMSCKVRQR